MGNHSAEPSFIFRLNDDGIGPELVKEAFYEKGWVEYDEDIHNELQWNIWWKTSRFRTSDYNQLYPWQRVNHYPKATGITRKDCLARLLKLQQALHGPAYSFAPQSYILPNDYRKFTQEFSSQAEKKSKSQACWICKPADLSRGRGITIIRELSELQYDTNSIVQQYIANPFLIHGHKFDMRLYAVVVSYHPLVIYLYNDGIVRFSCEKYDLSSLGNVYAHLTNTSINKHSSSYHTDKVGIGQGSKWTIKQLRHYLHQCHVDDSALWWKIIAIINLTIIPQITEVPRTTNSFELYGFDVLIDRNMKPWLLEVNFSPSLNNDCAVDSVKKDMMSDLIDLMEFKAEDALHGADTFQRRTRSGCRNGHIPQHTGAKAEWGSRRPRSMFTRLPKIGTPTGVPRNARHCVSVTDAADVYESENGEEETPHRRMDNILTCSLSHNNSLPSSLSTLPADNGLKRQKSLLSSRPSLRKHSTGLQDKCTPPPPHPITQARPKCHSKPWRQDNSSLKIQRIGSAEKNGSVGNKCTVGGFHRVYPFNAVTASKTLSPRQMVIETHQMIKAKLGEASLPLQSLDRKSQCKASKTTIVSPFPDLKGA